MINMRHVCGSSCFCRVHLFTLWYAPEGEGLPESGEHACPVNGCPVWHSGDRGAILYNERAGYVCDCEPEEIASGDGFGYSHNDSRHPAVRKLMHMPGCRLFSPLCARCRGAALVPDRPGEVMGTVFLCPFHDKSNQQTLDALQSVLQGESAEDYLAIKHRKRPLHWKDIGQA